jgi:hypothetical protein
MTATIVMVVVVVAIALAAVVLVMRAPGRDTAVVLPPAAPLTATDALAAFSETSPPARRADDAASVDIATPALSEASTAAIASTPLGWTTLVTEDQSVLDADARIRLLADLGIVRAPWCVPILIRAYDEERDPAVRRAVLVALSGFRNSPEAREALERAAAAPTAAANGTPSSNGAHAG